MYTCPIIINSAHSSARGIEAREERKKKTFTMSCTSRCHGASRTRARIDISSSGYSEVYKEPAFLEPIFSRLDDDDDAAATERVKTHANLVARVYRSELNRFINNSTISKRDKRSAPRYRGLMQQTLTGGT